MAEKPTVLLVIGPGGTAFNEQDAAQVAENIKKTGANLVVVGDGKNRVELDDIAKATANISGPMTLFLYTHGDAKEGTHYVGLTEDINTPTKDLFSAITKAREGNKFDIFMASCHGGAAQAAANAILPQGSKFVDLAPGEQTVAGADIKNFAETISNNKELASSFNGEKMLSDYLMTDLENRIPPSITVIGEGTYNLENILQSHLGVKLTAEQTKRVHESLDAAFGKDKVNSTIAKIENAKSEWDISALEFGSAMAVSYFAHEHNKNEAQLLSNFKKPEGIKFERNDGMQPFDDGFNKNSGLITNPIESFQYR